MSLLDLGAAQRGIWNAQLLDPTSPYYVVGEVLELDGLAPGAHGESPVDLLAEAVRLTVDESETLRLHFTDTARSSTTPRRPARRSVTSPARRTRWSSPTRSWTRRRHPAGSAGAP